MAITMFSLALMMGVVWIAQENLEHTILDADLHASRDLILANAHQDQTLHWDTGPLVAFYEPHDLIGLQELPEPFRDLPFPVSDERAIHGKTYLITATEAENGRLYLARDISGFERSLDIFVLILFGAGGIVLLLAVVLARQSSLHLIRPLQALTMHIRGMQPDRQMTRAPTDQQDHELYSIATSFNQFLEALEAYVKREQSLIRLSSHELRTPVAIVSGALTIIEQRGNLLPEDKRTLARAQLACNEMRDTIHLILRLGRRSEMVIESTELSIPALLHEVLDELRRTGTAIDRIVLDGSVDVRLSTDRALVKMLFSNLLGNALQHTAGAVHVQLDAQGCRIQDEGIGLPDSYRDLLVHRLAPLPQQASTSGLGLVIVSLICERLDWQLTVADTPEGGTLIQVRWPEASAQSGD